ncbi:MAG: NADAR family protein [Bacteroidia bacterium]|nr:NADAR family protein [Bacteroidia bacterium]
MNAHKQTYSHEWVQTREHNERVKFLFFWGHTSTPGQITSSCLSQWYESPFEVEGQTYRTCEHWMMAEKAKLFGNNETRSDILSANSPGEAKQLGRMVKNFDEEVWRESRYGIVVQGNLHKFGQLPMLRDYLLSTGERVLVEASPVDSIWGIGLTRDSEDAQYVNRWRGLNLLGFALMEVRDLLRSGHS